MMQIAFRHLTDSETLFLPSESSHFSCHKIQLTHRCWNAILPHLNLTAVMLMEIHSDFFGIKYFWWKFSSTCRLLFAIIWKVSKFGEIYKNIINEGVLFIVKLGLVLNHAFTVPWSSAPSLFYLSLSMRLRRRPNNDVRSFTWIVHYYWLVRVLMLTC